MSDLVIPACGHCGKTPYHDSDCPHDGEPWPQPVIPAPGDAETLEQRAAVWMQGAAPWPFPSSDATNLIRDLWAESRRLAGEVQRLERELKEAREMYEANHG